MWIPRSKTWLTDAPSTAQRVTSTDETCTLFGLYTRASKFPRYLGNVWCRNRVNLSNQMSEALYFWYNFHFTNRVHGTINEHNSHRLLRKPLFSTNKAEMSIFSAAASKFSFDENLIYNTWWRVLIASRSSVMVVTIYAAVYTRALASLLDLQSNEL